MNRMRIGLVGLALVLSGCTNLRERARGIVELRGGEGDAKVQASKALVHTNPGGATAGAPSKAPEEAQGNGLVEAY